MVLVRTVRDDEEGQVVVRTDEQYKGMRASSTPAGATRGGRNKISRDDDEEVAKLKAATDLPIAVGATSGETSVALGNLQVGVEADLPTSPVTLGGYLRVPTSTESGDRTRAQLVGVSTDYEQIGAYVSDFVTLSGLAEGRVDPALQRRQGRARGPCHSLG